MIYLTDGNMPLNNAYSGKIVQEDGSTYQLTFRFPTSDVLWEKLKEETFLTADDLHGEQDFVIFEVEKKNGYIQVYANQVFTLLNNYVVNPISLDRVTGTMALSRFAGAITRDNPFSFFSDISERHTFNTEAKNAMQVFAKDKHSILGQWGGDLVRHGYQVRLLKNGGSENESLFMYKKNLSSYQHKTSTKSLKTRITFKTTVKGEGENAPDRKFSVVVDSPLINKYSQIYEDVIEVNDQDVKDEASLRKYGEQYFKTSLCDMMEDSLELEVVGQSDVPVQMYDIVSLFHEVYNLDVRKKITKYTYSPMAKKLISIGFGQFKSGLANAIGNAVSDAVRGEAQQLHDDFEKQLERELKNADLAFEHQKEELVNQFNDGLNAAKAKAEEVKATMTDQLNLKINQSKSEVTDRLQKEFDQKLSSASADLAGVRANLTQAQSQLNSNISQIRSDVGSIRTKQTQAESEIAKQVQALNAAKNELAGVKSAQATFEQTTTRRLAELTNVADGKASKSELVQTAEELKSRIASVQTGSSRNYFRNSRSRSFTTNEQATYDYRLFIVPDFWQNKDRLKRDYVHLSFDVTFPVALARDMQANVHFSATPWYSYKGLVFKGGTTERQHFEFTINLSGAAETYQTNNVFIRFGTNYGFPAGLQVVIENAMLSIGNYYPAYQPAYEDQDERVSAVESAFKQRADSLEAGVNRLTEGLKTKVDSSALTVLSDRIQASVKSLETDTQNKLDSKLSTAEFNVRASGIRQEIVNATKDKADKTMVTAEAGKLREEFSKMKVGSRNYAEDYDFSRGLWYYSQGDNSPQDWTISNGEYNVKGTTKTWKQMQIQSKEGSRSSWKSSTALLDLEIGETYTLSFQGICYSGSPNIWVSLRANRTVPGNPEIMPGNFNLTSSWQTYQVTIPALTKPDNFDFWRIILGYNEIGHVAFRKVELTRSSTRIDAGPAPEDGKTDLVVAKSEFEKTAEGLSSKLATVETYVSQDGQRQEALRKYTRDESARQSADERKLIEAGYVAKATYAEDVRGLIRRFEELKSSSETKLAEYRQTVEGQFATISSQIGGSLKKTDISITPGQITLGTGKVVNGQTLASLFVQNPESIEAITKLMRITGDLIVDGSITGRDLAAGAITTPHLAAGAVTAEVLGANAVTADKVKADDALLEKLSAGEALLRKLMAKDAFVNRLQSIDFTAEQVKGGMIKALNGALKIDLNNGQYNVMTDQAAIRRVLNGYPNQFLKFTSETEGGAPASVTVLGANRDGTENSKNDSFAGIRLFSGNKVERTEIISDVVRFATGAVNYRGWEMRTLYGNDNRQVILQPFGNVTRSNIVANYFNGIDLVNVLETLNQMMANLGNHTGRHDIFGPIRGLGARKYVK